MIWLDLILIVFFIRGFFPRILLFFGLAVVSPGTIALVALAFMCVQALDPAYH